MAAAERLRRLAISLACLSCGDASDELVRHLQDLGPLPRRYTRCSGSVVATAMEVRHLFNSAFRMDWQAPVGRPRGRPPGSPNKPKVSA